VQPATSYKMISLKCNRSHNGFKVLCW